MQYNRTHSLARFARIKNYPPRSARWMCRRRGKRAWLPRNRSTMPVAGLVCFSRLAWRVCEKPLLWAFSVCAFCMANLAGRFAVRRWRSGCRAVCRAVGVCAFRCVRLGVRLRVWFSLLWLFLAKSHKLT